MTPDEYDAWYDTLRGRWIGQCEWDLLRIMLAAKTHENILDVGCGTGWFTRHLSQQMDCKTTGIDLDSAALNFARSRDPNGHYQLANACALPFPDQFFDRSISITCFNFVNDWQQALGEMVRVSRHRIVVGVLNKNSVLYRDKGRCGGTGAHQTAQWFEKKQIAEVLKVLPVKNVEFRSVIFLPSGSFIARTIEHLTPATLTFGGILMFSADILS